MQHNQDAIWEAFQNDPSIQGVGFNSARQRFVARRVKGQKVLNIGVGLGELEEMLVARGFDVYCLDPSAETIQRLRQRLQLGDKAQVGYASQLPFLDETFDSVIMIEVMEHLSAEETQHTLPEIRRVLRTGGRFLGTVPADENLLLSMVVCPHCAHRFHRWGHQQSFSLESLKQLLQQHFRTANVQRVHLAEFDKLNWKGYPTALLKVLQASFGLRGSNQNFYFEAIK